MKMKSKRGLTLPELLVTAVITVIIIGAAATLMVLGMRVFRSSSDTALQQGVLKLAESGLRENLIIAQSYSAETRISGQPVSTGASEICLYYEGSEFVIQTGNARITTAGLDGVSVSFIEEAGFCRAEYTLKTQGLEKQGTVVMNNIESVNVTLTDLLPGGNLVLRMTVPEG